eukprot:scaffold3186_cov125-Isochrysis_galbana.AAC.2
MSSVEWCARRANAQTHLSFMDGVIASLAGSQSMDLAAEGAGDKVLAGTICCVQKVVVVSAIGVGKVSGSQGINHQPLNLTNESRFQMEFEKPQRVL